MSEAFKVFQEKVKKFLKTNFPFEGVTVFDVTFRRERGGNTLRITVDGEHVDLDKCAEISRFLSEWLDSQEMSMHGKYVLEVSTPGLDRPLRGENDFRKFIGYVCKITLKKPIEGDRKNFKGKITEVKENTVSIYVADENTSFEIDIKNIKKSNLEIEF